MHTKNLPHKAHGFSLIELMIVVVIIGVLAAVAIPAYQNYLTKGRREDGKAKIMEVAQRLERYYSERLTYVTNATSLGYSAATVTSDKGNYVLTITASAAGIGSGYRITAVPQGIQLAKDTACGNLIYNSDNTRSVSGTGTNCW